MDASASNPSESELLANFDWVQRLALALTRDRAAAEDLAQDVARVWLERRPVLADGPRGWLRAVTRRLALDRTRSEAARHTRERSVARPEADREVVERGERQRRVAEAVLALEEPYRATILHRYLDGLSTRAVAARTDVPEATVRKRLERGLARLRERLDREFDDSARAWALLLLDPRIGTTPARGAGWMGAKTVAVAGGVVLLGGMAWMLRAPHEVARGGRAVVVPPAVAEAREREALAGIARAEPGREALPAEAVRSSAPRLHGWILVDDVRRAPGDLGIQLQRGRTTILPPEDQPVVSTASAEWALEDPPVGSDLLLWITSGSTVPAQIPLPKELLRAGGVVDLHLSTGRTLVLTFLDRETRAPLAHLDFELSNGIEIERGLGRVATRSHLSRHRTDVEGRAVLTGLAQRGVCNVVVDVERRKREVLMRGGITMTNSLPGAPIWSEWMKDDTPMRLERTLLARPVLGEGRAPGRLPSWAVAADAVLVVARERTDDSSRRGTSFVLPTDPSGGFELRASVPGRYSVQLQGRNGEPLSAEAEVAFEVPGPQAEILLQPLDEPRVTLRFVNVPASGEIEIKVGPYPRAAAHQMTLTCTGEPFAHEIAVPEGTRIELELCLGPMGVKASWKCLLEAGGTTEVVVDLAGRSRRLRLECAEFPLEGEGSVGLFSCKGGALVLDQSVRARCRDGRAIASAHVPDGRWLFLFLAGGSGGPTLWGVVDTSTPGEELVLRPRVRLLSAAELGPGLRLETVEGVSLSGLPEAWREVRPGNLEGPFAVPLDATWVALD